jgi:Leucine-rich repeat (LRR) protein
MTHTKSAEQFCKTFNFLIKKIQLYVQIKTHKKMKVCKIAQLSRENLREFIFHKIPTSAFSNLQTLFMGRMDYDWNQCQRNLEFMKNLQILHIYENPITQIPTECKVQTLVELNLGGCPLKEWSNVMKLSNLPKLQKLVGKITFCEFMDLI